MTREGLL